MAGRQSKHRETFGQIEKRASGRYRVRYTGPDGERYAAPGTFDNLTDARAWLRDRAAEIARGEWEPPEVVAARKAARAAQEAERHRTLGEYAAEWLPARTNAHGDHLRPRSVAEYKRLIAGPLADLTPMQLGQITPAKVRTWRAGLLDTGKKTQTSRAYGLLNAIMNTAVEDGLIDRSPCTIKGGQSTHTGRKVVPPTDAELQTILDTITPRYRALVLVAAVGGLRFGECIALRARDLTIERDDGRVVGVHIDVHRSAGRTVDGIKAGAPKTDAGIRRVGIFGDDARAIAEHARSLIGDALLFPAADGVGFLPQSAFWRHWDKARRAAGRPDLPFHGLRHYAGTMYAQTGATPRETMARLGHTSMQAAMRYQHSGNRDDELAARMRRRTTA